MRPRPKNTWIFKRSKLLIALMLIISIIPLGCNAIEIKEQGEQKWTIKFKKSDQIGIPVIAKDGTIYFANVSKNSAGSSKTEGNLYAIKPNGSIKWVFKFKGKLFDDSMPIVCDDRMVYFAREDKDGSSASVIAINPDGTKKWEFDEGNPGDPLAIEKDGSVLCCDRSGQVAKLVAINSDGTKRWEYATDIGYKFHLTAAGDNTIYFSVYSGGGSMLYALTESGSKKWSLPFYNASLTRPVVGSNGVIYFGSQSSNTGDSKHIDSSIYAVDSSGKQKWVYKIWELTYGPIVGKDNTIYFSGHTVNMLKPKDEGSIISGTDGIFALNGNGKLKWEHQLDGEPFSDLIVGKDGTVYFFSRASDINVPELNALNPDGTEKWLYTPERHVYPIPLIGPDNTIYVLENGQLTAIDEDSL